MSKYCEKCKRKIEDERFDFCIYCGNKLIKVDELFLINKEYEKLKESVVEEFNNKMKKEGCNIRYVKSNSVTNELDQDYKIIIQNRFMDNKYDYVINLSEEGEKEIREFFESRGVRFQFSNTVRSIV